MCGAGLDAHIVYNISATVKNALGKLSYWVGGFSQLGRRFPEFEVEAEGARYTPASPWSAGSATTAAIWKSPGPYRCWTTISNWCYSPAKTPFGICSTCWP